MKFPGIIESIDAPYNQRHLEQATHNMPEGDKFDYCFAWCLCNYYNITYNIPWNKIAEALQAIPGHYFDVITGYVKSISGFSHYLSKKLKIDYSIIRTYKNDIQEYSEKEQIKNINIILSQEKNNIAFIMRRYYKTGYSYDVKMHFTYVTLTGTEIHPYPDLSERWKFFGYRVYEILR